MRFEGWSLGNTIATCANPPYTIESNRMKMREGSYVIKQHHKRPSTYLCDASWRLMEGSQPSVWTFRSPPNSNPKNHPKEWPMAGGRQACCVQAKRKHIQRFQGILPESQDQNLAVTVLYAPSSLDSGLRRCSSLRLSGQNDTSKPLTLNKNTNPDPQTLETPENLEPPNPI